MRIMSTLKLLFSKITDDAPVYEKKDVVENIWDKKKLLSHIYYSFTIFV